MKQTLIKMRTIKELREAAGMTQSELAYKAGVSQTTIANWEQGRSIPALDQFRRVSNALNVRMDRIALTPYDRLLYVHRLWYHLQATHQVEGRWAARAMGVDFSEAIPSNDPYGYVPLPGPLDENDPNTTSVVVPVTWRWEAVGDTPDEAIQVLADRIVTAFERVYAQSSSLSA